MGTLKGEGRFNMLVALKHRVMETSRRKKEDHFYSLCKDGMTVLDVGVSHEKGHGSASRNSFLKNFKYSNEFYTGLGIQNLAAVATRHPEKKLIEYPGGRFPFEDKTFDWVFSNAVVEHTGDDEGQLAFVNEMLRVARSVFFTTPNKFFPVEAHTNVVFMHWYNEAFYQWCVKNRPDKNKNNLYLLSYARLNKLLKQSNATSYTIFRNRCLGWTMTFSVLCRQ